MVQAVPAGTGANGRCARISFVHAAARFGSVPPTGAHLSVYVFLTACSPTPPGHTVMWSEVEATTRIVARMLLVPG